MQGLNSERYRIWRIEIPGKLDFTGKIIPAPDRPEEWENWREELYAWRERTRQALHYQGELYNRQEFSWVSACFACCLVMLFDQAFYDPHSGEYCVDTFLDAGEKEFGGYDAIVLWHAYPRIGFDERNQFDFYRDMPGGLEGLREASRGCHARGVKVFLDYNPWDRGTRREAKTDLDSLVDLVQAIEADGIFLDTLKQGGSELRAALDAIRPGVALESEGMTPLEHIEDHPMSWGQWAADSHAPGVLRNKWFERRHMVHMVSRWDRDHSGEIQAAWMNGAGMLVWENVFGSWNGWSPRDRSLLRSILPVQRRYASLFANGHWTPLAERSSRNVYASLWEAEGLRLWTVANRSSRSVRGLWIRNLPAENCRYFDLLRGVEIYPQGENGSALGGDLPARGTGAFLACPDELVDPDFLDFLGRQAAVYQAADWSRRFPARQARLRPRQKTKPRQLASLPEGMNAVPGGSYTITQRYRHRECGMYDRPMYVNVRSPKLPDFHGMRYLTRTVELDSFAIDEREVTNGEYYRFLGASGYRPKQAENFLRHWVDGAPAPGTEEDPVVYIDLEDARAYAGWAGKRLPSELEWQAAMERTPRGPGRRVWNWTESEYSDGRTRFCILKGGCDYAAAGSEWYADGGPQEADFAAKFVLMWPGLDRCATIGFRCAVGVGGKYLTPLPPLLAAEGNSV